MTDLQSLESIVSLTQERDKKSLENALIEMLSEHCDFDAAFLLSIPRGVKADQLEVMSYYVPQSMCSGPLQRPHINMPIDDSIKRCLKTGDVITQQNGNTLSTMYPLVVNEEVTGIVQIYSSKEIIEEDRLIRLLIKVYSNFIGIINDSEYDKLTGLLNRKAFDEHIAELLLEAEQASTAFVASNERRNSGFVEQRWLGVLDIDHFKRVNDTYGHLYGDEVLVIFSEVMRRSFRSYDLLFRYGGEEFIVILSAVNEENSIAAFERFRSELEKQVIPQVKGVTVSIGVSILNHQAHPKSVLEQADRALYYSKEKGRNQVSSYQQLIDRKVIRGREFDNDVEFF